MPKFNDVTLILGAHGSEAASDSNAPVVDLANQIESLDLFAKVTPAFLLGQPNMTNVLAGVSTEKVVVVPLMTSSGYYLNSVIPKKLAENENADKCEWLISPVAGMHDRIADLMIDRIRMRRSENEIAESDTTIALIGHGTRRNKNSAKSTFALFEKIKLAFPNARNRVAFLDQDPEAPLVGASIVEGHTIVVPFLVSRGPHTTVDVPESFGLPSGPEVQFPIVQTVSSRSGPRITIVEQPLAYYPEMADICIELATEAIENNQRLTLPELEIA
jgi:sirohydrochlorin cobaltochelatase